MKRVVLLLLILFSASAANAQVSGTPPGRTIPMPVPPIAPFPFFGPSMSVIDHSGNLLVFDVSSTYPTPVPGAPTILSRFPISKTRLTVIRSNGRKDAQAREFEGTVQIIGAGFFSVYVITNSNTMNVTDGAVSFTTKRRLIAINLDSNTQPTPIDVPQRADVKLSAAADAQHLDTLSFVDPPANPFIMKPRAGGTSTSPVAMRFARLITCDGKSFSSTEPVPLP